MNWIRAIKGEAEATSLFEYAAPLTETMLLGLVSLRANQQKLRWDAEAGTVTNVVTARDLMHMRLGAASAGGAAHFEADEALSEVNA
ncbi:MAG: hypothetical protein BRD27_01985 [Bacteroidetes bacterium QH_10_64_19]|nr:MAG: hypothetical protein BRD27_01985 [Bacteroidetes bacterium QH_10_64_19]